MRHWYPGRVVRHRSAKPSTAVRIRWVPQFLLYMIGNLHLFSFPLNAIIGLVILYAGWRLRHFIKDTHISIALVVLLAVVLTEGLLPSRIPFTRSWPFVTILTLFLIVWGARLFRSFSLLGAGLWLALLAGMLGSADEYNTSLTLPAHQYVQAPLPFEIRLDRFTIDRYATGEPLEYVAVLSLKEATDRKVEETSARLRVNHPVRYKGYQIFLLDYEETPHKEITSCTVLVTRQPWNILVLLGILLMMGGAVKNFFV